jgi:O-antigen ligase
MTRNSISPHAEPSWRVRLRDKFDLSARAALVVTAFFTPISTALMNAGFAVLLVLFLFAGSFRERFLAISRQPIVWAVVGFFFFMCLGSLWTIGPLDEAGWQLSKYSKLLLVPLVMSLAVTHRTRVAVIAAVLAALLLTMLLSYVNALYTLPAWLSRATREGVLTGNNYIFKHHIIQNVFLSFGALVCFIFAMSKMSRPRQLLFAVLGVACSASVMFMAQGRTGYLTLAAVLCVVVWLLIKHHPKLRWAAVVLVVLAVAGVGLSSGFQQRVKQVATDFSAFQETGVANPIGHRLLFWRTSVDIMKQHPLFGAGTGAYRQEFLKRVSDPTFTNYGAYNPHNQYLYIGTQLGIVGMALFIAMLAIFWTNARKLPWQRRALAQGTVLILAIYSMFDSPIFITEGHFFVILLGTLWAGADWRSQGAKPTSEEDSMWSA